jgi:hypothetical protein
VQKIANKTSRLPERFTQKNEFRAMLKLIQKQASKLDSKNLVDTVYSLGKIKKFLPPETYFMYVVGDLIKESTRRTESLSQMEIAYFCKGLTNLNTYIGTHPQLQQIEQEFRTTLLCRLEQGVALEPYSISKVLRYLLKFNSHVDQQAMTVFQSLAHQLVQTL